MQIFLGNCDRPNIKAQIIERSLDGKNKIPVGEFIVKAILEQGQASYSDINPRWVVMAAVDGMPLIHMPIRTNRQDGTQLEQVGREDSVGYYLHRSKIGDQSVVVFSYRANPGSALDLEHPSFRYEGGIIAANLFCLDRIGGIDDDNLDLKTLKPVQSTVVRYQRPQ